MGGSEGKVFIWNLLTNSSIRNFLNYDDMMKEKDDDEKNIIDASILNNFFFQENFI